MKQTKLFSAAFILLAAIACQKEQEKPIEKVSEPSVELVEEDSTNFYTITATTKEADTKAYVDGLQVKWNENDEIVVAVEGDNAVVFQLSDGENTANGTFRADLGGKALGSYAVYPNGSDASFSGNTVYTNYLSSWAYGKAEVPMYGSKGAGDAYTFANVGGAIKVNYTNVPSGAKKFVISEVSASGSEKFITGAVEIDNMDSTPSVKTSYLDGRSVEVTDITPGDITLVIPLPAQSGYKFNVKLVDASSNAIPGSEKNANGITITQNKLKPFPTIDLKATKDALLWGEDFSLYSADEVPGDGEGEGWGGTVIDYSVENGGGTTKIYAQNTAGGESPEILVGKSNGTFVAANIPTAGWTKFTLTYYTNQSGLSVLTSIAGAEISNAELIGEKHYRRTIDIKESAALYQTITFKMTSGSNARLDGIELRAGLPEPGISVTTNSATAISATGATLNGTIELTNGAKQASITEAGFVYKVKDAGAFGDPVTIADPTASLVFSKSITGLSDGTTYTFKAYAKYDGGDAVYGDEIDYTAETPAPKKDYTVSWTVSSGALGSTIASVNGTATGTIATEDAGGTLSHDWNYTRKLVSLASKKSDYISMVGTDSSPFYQYMQLGSGNALEQIVFTTTEIPGTIKSISVDCGGDLHKISATVAGTSYITETNLTSAGAIYTNTGTGESSGAITISILPQGSTKKAFYIKSITVVYNN